MTPNLSRAITLAFILAVIPASTFHARAQDAGEEPAEEVKPNQFQIINNSHSQWNLNVSSSSMGDHKFKQITIDNKTMALTLLKPKKSSGSKYDLLEGRTYDFQAAAVGRKNGTARITLEDGRKNKFTFCLFSKAGKMKLFLEKAELWDEMDVEGVLELNKPAPGSLTINDKAHEK